MIVMMMAMGVIMLAMVVMMMVSSLTPFDIDLFIIVLLNMSMCCMRDFTTTAGSERSQDCGTTDTGCVAPGCVVFHHYAHDHSSCTPQLS